MTQYGARGKVEWYYNLGKNERGSMVHFDGRNIHPTMDYERSREGIDDLKYLYKLEPPPVIQPAKLPPLTPQPGDGETEFIVRQAKVRGQTITVPLFC